MKEEGKNHRQGRRIKFVFLFDAQPEPGGQYSNENSKCTQVDLDFGTD